MQSIYKMFFVIFYMDLIHLEFQNPESMKRKFHLENIIYSARVQKVELIFKSTCEYERLLNHPVVTALAKRISMIKECRGSTSFDFFLQKQVYGGDGLRLINKEEVPQGYCPVPLGIAKNPDFDSTIEQYIIAKSRLMPGLRQTEATQEEKKEIEDYKREWNQSEDNSSYYPDLIKKVQLKITQRIPETRIISMLREYGIEKPVENCPVYVKTSW